MVYTGNNLLKCQSGRCKDGCWRSRLLGLTRPAVAESLVPQFGDEQSVDEPIRASKVDPFIQTKVMEDEQGPTPLVQLVPPEHEDDCPSRAVGPGSAPWATPTCRCVDIMVGRWVAEQRMVEDELPMVAGPRVAPSLHSCPHYPIRCGCEFYMHKSGCSRLM